MSGGLMSLIASSGGSGVVATGQAWATGSATFGADGSVGGNPSLTGPAAWITPGFAGIGASYWMRLTKSGGTRSFSPAAGTWVSLASNVLVIATGGAGSVTGTIEFSTDSGGATIVGTNTLSVDNTL